MLSENLLVAKGSYPVGEKSSPGCHGIPEFKIRICGLAHIAEHFNPQLYFFYQKGSSGLRRLKRPAATSPGRRKF